MKFDFLGREHKEDLRQAYSETLSRRNFRRLWAT